MVIHTAAPVLYEQNLDKVFDVFEEVLGQKHDYYGIGFDLFKLWQRTTPYVKFAYSKDGFRYPEMKHIVPKDTLCFFFTCERSKRPSWAQITNAESYAIIASSFYKDIYFAELETLGRQGQAAAELFAAMNSYNLQHDSATMHAQLRKDELLLGLPSGKQLSVRYDLDSPLSVGNILKGRFYDRLMKVVQDCIRDPDNADVFYYYVDNESLEPFHVYG